MTTEQNHYVYMHHGRQSLGQANSLDYRRASLGCISPGWMGVGQQKRMTPIHPVHQGPIES